MKRSDKFYKILDHAEIEDEYLRVKAERRMFESMSNIDRAFLSLVKWRKEEFSSLLDQAENLQHLHKLLRIADAFDVGSGHLDNIAYWLLGAIYDHYEKLDSVMMSVLAQVFEEKL